MHPLTERNARRNRQMALWLAVGFHFALGTAVYFNTSEPKAHTASAPAPTHKVTTVAKPTTTAKPTTAARPTTARRNAVP